MSTRTRASSARLSMQGEPLSIDIKIEPEELKCETEQQKADFYCRVCFRLFHADDNRNDLDGGTVSTLRDLLQTSLKLSTGSQSICDECSSLISSFYAFKTETIEKQAKFGQLMLKNRHHSAIEIQKISTSTHELDALQATEVFVKQEPHLVLADFHSDEADWDESFSHSAAETATKTTTTTTTARTKMSQRRNYTRKRARTKCDECGATVLNLINHRIKKHGYKHLFECPRCEFQSYDKRKLQLHCQSMHSKRSKDSRAGDTSRICPHCAKTVRFLEDHIANIHMQERNYFCDLCNFSSYKKKPIEQHMMNIHLPKSIQCSLCEFKTISNERLKRHIRNVHEVREQPVQYFCTVPDCKKSFRNKHNLQCHVRRRHEGEVQFPCTAPDCSKSFFSKSERRIHYENAHGPKNVICEECGNSFSSQAMLRKHSTLHKEYRYACQYCDVKYRNSTELKNHTNRVHLDRKEHACEDCDAAFYTARDLYRHITSKHLGIKFVCEVPGCSATLSRSDAYHSHLKSHSGISEELRKELYRKLQDFCASLNLKRN